MYSLNKVQIIGNVASNPDVRQTSSGTMVATLGVATNRVWKDKTGQKHDDVEFHNICCWGRLAEIAGQWLRKGQKVYFEGRLQTRSWEDQNGGKKRYKTEIVAEQMIILSKQKISSPRGTSSSAPEPPRNDEDYPEDNEVIF